MQVWVYKTIQLKTSLQTQRHCMMLGVSTYLSVSTVHGFLNSKCMQLISIRNQQVLKVELEQELRTDHLYATYATYKFFEIHGYESKGYKKEKQRSYSITFWNLYQFIHLWHIAKLRTNVNKTSGHGLSHFDITTYFIRP